MKRFLGTFCINDAKTSCPFAPSRRVFVLTIKNGGYMWIVLFGKPVPSSGSISSVIMRPTDNILSAM